MSILEGPSVLALGASETELPRVSAQTLEQTVYNTIREAILDLRLHPGDALVESALTKQLGVSKTPVRGALIRLEREGLVQNLPARGRIVAELDINDVKEIFEIRELLDCYLARYLAVHAPESLLDDLAEIIDTAEQYQRQGDQHTYFMYVRKFDRRMYDSSPNRRMAAVQSNFHDLIGFIGAVAFLTPGRIENTYAEHSRILNALRARDPDLAAQCMTEHIQSILRDYLSAVHQPS